MGSCSFLCVESGLNAVQLQLVVAAFQRGKLQEITQQADHALISELAAGTSFHYLTQMHTDVQAHTQTD